MVFTVPPQQPPTAAATSAAQSQPQPQPLSAEEEALKRNTDCVYFLASPLTCKKGSECEYRHSDIARVNPRDCWYWLNGNCLNPKCAFRHPPLEGLFGTQAPSPTGSSLPAVQAAATPIAPAPAPTPASGKQGVPCIFFQKGYCLKGDRCPFFHAPTSVNNKAPQAPPAPAAAAPVIEPPSSNRTVGGLVKCMQDKKAPQVNFSKPAELTAQNKPLPKVDSAPARNDYAKNVGPSSGSEEDFRRYRPVSNPTFTNGNPMSRSASVQQPHLLDDHSSMNSKDAEEFSRDPSPTFDVLVDDELGDSEYYHNEDQYGRRRSQEGTNEYEVDRSDYRSMTDIDRDMYRENRGYDSYERQQGQYAWDQPRASSERISGRSGQMERKRYPRTDSPDQVEELDLRHRLSKHRRANNGLRSVITHDHVRERHNEDRVYQGSRRDSHRVPPQEISVSNRLRGRIRMPGRSTSPSDGSDLRFNKQIDQGRDRGRLSPSKSQTSAHQGRLRDRIKGRVQEDFNNIDRNNSAMRMRRDATSDDNVNFAGPKSLAQLKGGRNAESSYEQINDHQSVGKRRYSKLEENQQSGGDLSFEGPKPLEEILKRKRELKHSGDGKATRKVESEDAAKEKPQAVVVESGSATEETNMTKEVNLVENRTSLNDNAADLEVEDGMIVDDGGEDQEHEAYDGEDEYYDQEGGEDYEEGENGDAEEEYLDDDDDGDDFAKKMGVMFS